MLAAILLLLLYFFFSLFQPPSPQRMSPVIHPLHFSQSQNNFYFMYRRNTDRLCQNRFHAFVGWKFEFNNIAFVGKGSCSLTIQCQSNPCSDRGKCQNKVGKKVDVSSISPEIEISIDYMMVDQVRVLVLPLIFYFLTTQFYHWFSPIHQFF